MQIMWYDSMTKDGRINWQNALTDKNKAAFCRREILVFPIACFLNFWWRDQQSSFMKAQELGRSPYDCLLELMLKQKEQEQSGGVARDFPDSKSTVNILRDLPPRLGVQNH